MYNVFVHGQPHKLGCDHLLRRLSASVGSVIDYVLRYSFSRVPECMT